MERTIVRSICLICHKSFEHESQENISGFRRTWNRIWEILVQHFHLEPPEWEEILHFYDQAFELPLCPSKCRKDVIRLLNLNTKLDLVLQEMDKIKGNLTTTILNTSSSNKEVVKMETEIISSQDLQKTKNGSKIISDKSIHEKINELRNHIVNRQNPNVLIDDTHDSEKERTTNKDSDKDTNVFSCQNSNNNSSITTEPATIQESQFKNNITNSSSSNIDNEAAKVVVKQEKETIINANSDNNNMTVIENDCLLNDFQSNGDEMMEDDPLINEEVEANVGKIKEEQLKEGIFSYKQWSYVQLEGDDMFTCLKCQDLEKSQEEMIQHIQRLHEQTETEVSILGIPHDSDQHTQQKQTPKKKRTTKVNRQTLMVPKGKLNVKSRWSCNYPGCGKVYRDRDRLIVHKKVHIDTFYNCPLCRTNSRLKIEVEDHIRLSHPENSNLVPFEFFKTIFTPTSSTATSTSTNDEPLKKINVTRKIRKSKTTEGPSHFCKICKKGFYTSQGLFRHNEADHEGVIYKCPVCGLQKGHIQSIQYHLKSSHPHVDISAISIRKERRSKTSKHYANDSDDNDDQDLSFDDDDNDQMNENEDEDDDIVILD